MSTVVVTGSNRNPGCLIQFLWFVLVGWWAGQIWIAVAWLLMLTVVGIPLGVMMMNKVPQVIALRGQSSGVAVTSVGNVTVVAVGASVPQQSVIIRALYFVLIGWWLSALWMEVAYFFCMTIVLMPLGFMMFDKVPALVSLHRD
mgnify:CR=1 FL=1|jgi:uncharacterized membrane protein YccF (DUF307 family)